jgi:AraC-like DNA-binding protein
MSEQMEQPQLPYSVTNVKYGEKTVRGRVIGRDKTVIPEEQVAQLAQYHCTNREIADFFGVPLQTFMDNFRDILDKNRLITKQRLRKAQLDLALKGDRTMLIFLGKVILGQREDGGVSDEDKVLPWTTETPE